MFLKIRKKNNLSYFITSICTIIITLSLSFLYKEGSTAEQSKDGTVVADLNETLSITEVTEMDFGTVIPPSSSSADIVILPSDDAIDSCGSDAVCEGTATRGEFTILGDNSSITISYTDGTLSDGSNTITADVDSVAVGNSTSETISGGTLTLYTGASININPSEDRGTYNTTNAGGAPYTVSVAY